MCGAAPLSGCNPSGSAGPGRPCSARWLSSQTVPKHPASEGGMEHRETTHVSYNQAPEELRVEVFTQIKTDHIWAPTKSIENNAQVCVFLWSFFFLFKCV